MSDTELMSGYQGSRLQCCRGSTSRPAGTLGQGLPDGVVRREIPQSGAFCECGCGAATASQGSMWEALDKASHYQL